MSFDLKKDTYAFSMYNHIYNHTKGDVPLGALHSLHVLNQLKIVELLQNGYVEEDTCIVTRRIFGAELKIRRLMKEQNSSSR